MQSLRGCLVCSVSSVLYASAGAMRSQAAEQPLTAAIRTYKSSPKRREAAPATVQQSVSPARSTSYSLQKASLRRSLSPNIGRQAPALRQPQWDSSKRPSPQRAQHAAILNPAYASDMTLDSEPSPQHAKHSLELQNGSRLEAAQHAEHATEGSPQPGAGSAEMAGKASQVRRVGESTPLASPPQVLKPQLVVGKSVALSSAASDSTTNASAEPGSSSFMQSSATGLRSGSRGQTSRTPTLSPPRFRRLPPNNLSERPAWASTTTSRAAAPAPQGGSSPLRRSTGSTIIIPAPQGEGPPPPHPTTDATPQDAGTSKAVSSVPQTAAVSVSQLVRPEDLQASSESHADFLADSQAHAHAQSLQELQQAVGDYHSSSPHVLVPAAVELAAALRRAAKGPAAARPSLEALQLAGLKLKHEGREANSPGQSVPTTPWPDWVRGAWGSPQARARGANEPATAATRDPEGEAQAEASSNAKRETVQRARRDTGVSGAKPSCNGWSPVRRPESQAGRRRSALVSRALAEAEAAAAKSPQSGLARPHNPPRAATASTTANPRTSATPPRGSAKPARASAMLPTSVATSPGGAVRPSRVSATPHRAAATPPRVIHQAERSSQPVSKALPPKKLHASLSQASQAANSPWLQDNPAVASHPNPQEFASASLHASKGHSVPVVEGKQSAERAKPPPGRRASVQSQQRESAMQAFGLHTFAQHTHLMRADRGRGHSALLEVDDGPEQPAEAQHSGHAEQAEDPAAALHSAEAQRPSHAEHAEASPAALHSPSNINSWRPSHAEDAAAALAGQHSNSKTQHHAVVVPLRSVTSVAALRQSFELMSPSAVASVESVKPRNRLPLRKVSSKAHVHEDDGSPQQATLLWQQSLRVGDDGPAEEHAEPDQAMQQGNWISTHLRLVEVRLLSGLSNWGEACLVPAKLPLDGG